MTTDGARLNIIGGDSSIADVGIYIDGKSSSKEGVCIVGASGSGEGILIEGFSPAYLSSIHLKNSGNGGGIRLSGIGEGANKILVSGDIGGNAAWVSPNVAVFNFNEYISDAAADADVTLPSGALYRLTGGRTIYQKP